MIQQLTLDDRNGLAVTLHRTSTRRLTSASGIFGVGPLRDVVRSRPQMHGAINDTRFQDGQPITLEGVIIGTSDAAAATDFQTIASAALQTLDYAPALLKWTIVGGQSLQRMVKLAGALDPVLAPQEPRSMRYQMQLLAEDPRAYSQTIGTSTASGTANVSVVNAGNRPTPPVYRVWGSAVNPQIVNVTDSTFITISGTIAASNYIQIDTWSRTAFMSATPTVSAINRIDPATTTWSDLAAGTTTLHLTHVSGTIAAGSQLDVVKRDAYL